MEGTEVKIFKQGKGEGEEEGGRGANVNVECERAADLFNPTEEEQGEICFRGRHIMLGYMANPDLGDEHVAEINQKTEESIDEEGWLHSGDKGCIDDRGMLRITGRYKELIIGAGGENVAPVPIEDNVKKLCPGISNAMMVGDRRKYNVLLVTLKTVGATGELPGSDQLAGAAKEVDPEAKTIAEAQQSAAWKAAIDKAVTETNSNPMICQNNAWKV